MGVYFNIIGIPLAAGALVAFGLTLNPMFGAAAMSLSSFCVVSNALRLNFCDIYSTKRDRKRKAKTSGGGAGAVEESFARCIYIKGMMCGHCENRVKTALEALPQVESAEVSHEKGTAMVTLSAAIDNKALKHAVEEQGYKVTSIKVPDSGCADGKA